MTSEGASQQPGPDGPAFDGTEISPVQPDGSVEGYLVHQTLPLRVELWRQIRRRRTWVTLGLLVLLPWMCLLAFQLGDGGDPRSSDAADTATTGGLNFTLFILFASTNLLLLMVVALFFGDTVASEASWSSLKYLLAAPVPRLRLLRQKMLVSALLTGVAMTALFTVSLVTGSAWYGAGDLLTVNGETLSFPAGLLRLVGALAYLAIHLLWIAGLAAWFGVGTASPLGAVGGSMLVAIVCQILDEIEALGALRSYLPTHYSMAWADLISTDVDWVEPACGIFSALAYASVFTLLAAQRFAAKDITT